MRAGELLDVTMFLSCVKAVRVSRSTRSHQADGFAIGANPGRVFSNGSRDENGGRFTKKNDRCGRPRQLEKSKAVRVEVSVAETSGDLQRIESLEEGAIASGMQLILDGAYYVSDQEAVNPVEEVTVNP